MKFNCEKCGDVDSVIIHGYPFGDRLLEDVFFKVYYKDGKLVAEITTESADYFEQLNSKKWLKACVEHVEESVDDCEGQCPICEQDIYLDSND